MYAWNIRIKLKANSALEFSQLIEQKIIPLLRAQNGFRDAIVLVAPQRDEAMAMSFWDNQTSADVYNHVAYLDVLRILSTVVKTVPVVETFDVIGRRLQEAAANVS
jgi:hypothetical protein